MKKAIGIVISPDGQITTQDFSGDVITKVHAVVGGLVEHVRPRGLMRPYCMLVNEEGLLIGLDLNLIGSYLYQTHIHGAPIVGTIVLMKERPVGGFGDYDIIGLSDKDVAYLTKMLSKIASFMGIKEIAASEAGTFESGKE